MLTRSLLLALITCVFAAAHAADDAPARKDGKPAIVGELVAVSAEALTVKTQDGNKTVAINAQTKIKLDGQDATVNDLKPGMAIHAPINPGDVAAPVRRVNAKTKSTPK